MGDEQKTNELEICCYNAHDAKLALECGADRVELCAGEPEGGTTPSLGTLTVVADQLGPRIFVMVRPRGRTFVYDSDEVAAMAIDASVIARLGFAGIVVGALTPTGELDIPTLTTVVQAARQENPDINVTFHRAFDEVRDPRGSAQTLAGLGIDRILSSGQAPTAHAGIGLLTELAAGTGPTMMAGGGVRPQNVELFLAAGITDVHSSAQAAPGAGVDPETVAKLVTAVHKGTQP